MSSITAPLPPYTPHYKNKKLYSVLPRMIHNLQESEKPRIKEKLFSSQYKKGREKEKKQ